MKAFRLQLVLSSAWAICCLSLTAIGQQPHLDVTDAEHLKVDRNTAIRTGVEWLIENQNEDGTWGSHHSPRPIEVLCDVPGSHHVFRIATTSLCVMALAKSPYQTEAGNSARSRGIDAILSQSNVKRASGFEHYTPWALSYGLQALSEHLLTSPHDPRAATIRDVCAGLIKRLGIHQCLDGGWGYLSLDEVPTFQPSFTSMSFTTATCLIALARAKDVGMKVPAKMVERAASSIARCETPAKAFTYGEIWRKTPLGFVNNIKGAAARGPNCLEALALYGRELKPERLMHALNALLIDHTRFQIAGLRRPIPHESHYGVSGYFYLFGHYYASMSMLRLSAQDQNRYGVLLQKAVLLCRQPDGSFWDYPLYSYHKPYGTAYAILSLSTLSPEMDVQSKE